MRNIDYLMRAYGVILFTKKYLSYQETDRDKILKTLNQSGEFIENLLKHEINGSDFEDLKKPFDAICSISEELMRNVTIHHTSKNDKDRFLLQEAEKPKKLEAE